MKKILFLIAVLSAMLFTTTAFAIQGEGTEESPFLITNQEELMLVSDFLDCHFKLMNDIELEGGWTPLCNSHDGFKGVFDGNGKTISNLLTDGSDGGLFDSNSGIIKNLNVMITVEGMTGSAGITDINYGTISNCIVKGDIFGSFDCMGGICGNSYGEIENCKFEGNIENEYLNGTTGGICGSAGYYVSRCAVIGNVTGKGITGGICGGISGEKEILNCYFIGEINSSDSDKSGISGMSYGSAYYDYYVYIYNCYAVPIFESGGYGITSYNDYDCVRVSRSYYDKTVTGKSDYKRGTPKSTAAMKMKKTYTDAGWDFENVWGIDENINDGYPYLLWEYAETSSASAEITSASSTPTSLKFVSTVATEGEPEIATFGTTFIPLWLFESGSSDVATVSYDNSKYDIQNGQTFGATLSNIPEAAKDMVIVGKSFVKDAEGNYTWSAAKSASVNNTELVELK